jgi:hypothetical protein
MGTRVLYVALKGQSSNAGNLAYLSYRKAQSELGIRSFSKVSDWFSELCCIGTGAWALRVRVKLRSGG